MGRTKPTSFVSFFKGIGNFVKTGTVPTPWKDRYIERLKREKAELNNKIYGGLYDPNGIVADEPTLKGSTEINRNEPETTYRYNSGLEKKSNAYKNLYNTYYSGYTTYFDKYTKDEEIFKHQLKPQVDYLKKTELTGLDFSFDSVQKQNQILTNQIKDNKEKYSIDIQKVNYQSEKIDSLKAIYVFVFAIFYIVLLGLIYILFAVNTTMSRNIKIAIVVLFAFYPFYVNVLQQLLYFLGKYIFAIMNWNVYTPNNY